VTSEEVGGVTGGYVGMKRERETHRYSKGFRSVENGLFPVGVLCLGTC
jgi:hypothetical protein